MLKNDPPKNSKYVSGNSIHETDGGHLYSEYCLQREGTGGFFPFTHTFFIPSKSGCMEMVMSVG